MNASERAARLSRIQQEYAQRYGKTLKEWLIYHQQEIVFEQSTYMGLPAYKNPLDAWIYQELVHRVRPEVVVEIGSAIGGSTLYLAHLLQIVGTGTVVSVDKDRSEFRPEEANIVAITGDSSSQSTFEQVAEQCELGTVLIIHDGDHSYKAVLRELRLYGPLVSVGSYFIVEDGIVDLFESDEMGFPGPGPLHAIVEFLEEDGRFEIDTEAERYKLTYNPHGFLKRVR